MTPVPLPASPTVVRFAGRAGDTTDRAYAASARLAASLADRFGTEVAEVGLPRPPLAAGWATELASATPELRALAEAYRTILTDGGRPATALSRCAAAIATVPVVARHRPDAVVVWFDAHPDLNTPSTSASGFLGGMALAGPLGFWESGLGAGLDPANTVLVGTRAIDPPEQELLDTTAVATVPYGPRLVADLDAAVGRRPVYVHLDCDVLEAGVVSTGHTIPGGLSLADLHQACAALAVSEVVGVEIAELESPTDAAGLDRLLAALAPLLDRLD